MDANEKYEYFIFALGDSPVWPQMASSGLRNLELF